MQVLGPTKSGWGCVLYRYCRRSVFFELDELPEEIKIEREESTAGKIGRDRLSRVYARRSQKTIMDPVVGAWPCAIAPASSGL